MDVNADHVRQETQYVVLCCWTGEVGDILMEFCTSQELVMILLWRRVVLLLLLLA